MSALETTTVGDVGRWFGRFGPYVGLVAVVTLVVGLAPGDRSDQAGGDVLAGAQVGAGLDGDAGVLDPAAPAAGGAGVEGGAAAPGAVGTDAVTVGDTAGTGGGSATDGGTGSTAGGAGATAGGATGGGTGVTAPTKVAAGAVAPKNCDPGTGRVKMPSVIAPRCVPGFDGDNGGATYRGVTKDTIKVAVYLTKGDATSSAITAAGGADDTPEETKRQYREWFDLYAANLETYGRKIQLEFIEASGEATDASAARADALRVIKSGAFASINSPNNTYVAELAAKGVMCIQCGILLPAESYAKFAPYVWNYSSSTTWSNLHNVEFAAKYLAGKPAVHAGDPTMRTKTRVLGRVSYDTPDGSYKAAREFYEKEMARRGIKLAEKVVYNGYPDTAKSQQQARPIIQKMKAAGVTTVIFVGDPFAPVFFTQEATRQQYFPEWVSTGVLVDTAFFARLYDQQQWRNMFAPTPLTARLPEGKTESDRLLQWYYGRGPSAPGGYNLIRLPAQMLLEGIHYAGEKLTPQTYAAGQFAQPVRKGGKTFAGVSYGTRLWPIADYTGVDDTAFVWWDPTARGEDEIGNPGVGLYRYVNGGQRYLPKDYPSSIKWFDPAGTVTLYEDYPADERPPSYPSPKR